jgi:hypothetical protein
LFHLLCLGFILLQAHESRLPLGQFRIGQGDILDDRIALIFILNLGSVPFGFRSIRELPLRKVKDRTLDDRIRKSRRRSVDAEGESIGFAEPGTNHELRHVGVVDFPVGSKGPLHIGVRNRRTRAVGKGEPNGAIESYGFSVAGRCGHCHDS